MRTRLLAGPALLLVAILARPPSVSGQPPADGAPGTHDLEFAAYAAAIGTREVVFFAQDLEGATAWRLGRDAVDRRQTPYSTFKIPNLLIAMDTGVARGLDHERRWDPGRRPRAPHWPAAWARDHTLRTAFQRSVVWYFQDLALEIGAERYRDALRDFRYGNGLAREGSDVFWLEGPLAISPREQVAFLRRIIRQELDVSPAALDALRRVSLLEETRGCALHGKTGLGPVTPDRTDGPFGGWLVGWAACGSNQPIVFALYARGATFAAVSGFRREMAERLLKDIGALPAHWPSGGRPAASGLRSRPARVGALDRTFAAGSPED